MRSNDPEIPSIIKRGLPNAVTYDLSAPDHVTITLPTGSTWSSGLHWHERHVEYLLVVQGAVRVRLGDMVHVISAATDDVKEIRVDRHIRHEWSRADPDGEDVVVTERTEPQDGEKALFFWNLNGVILDAQAEAGKQRSQQKSMLAVYTAWLWQVWADLRVTLSLFVIFRSLDNFPVFDISRAVSSTLLTPIKPELGVWAEWCLTHLVLGAAAALAWAWRIEPVRREYTPDDVYRKWRHGLDGRHKRE